ncbi:MAG TPA: glutathione binding-like protein, partial [Polyangiaceae bacterium]|nr:glutathione binding-like protein [Polyangiaceae bacterium]
VDSEGPEGKTVHLFESGAILLYLAEKTGKLIPADPMGRLSTWQWLFWQVGGVGPMFGQAGHFVHYAKEKIPYAIERYTSEVNRLLKVLEQQLAKQGPYLVGETYSIADIAVAPWVDGLSFYGLAELLEPHEHIRRWLETFKARPAVQKGWNV